MTIDLLLMIRVLILLKQGRQNEEIIIEIYLRKWILFYSEVETVQITENTVNPNGERVSPHDFQLLKVLGKGGYGKVRKILP